MEFDPVTFELVWEYRAEGFYSHYISSAQRLPNGNTLITEGANGRIFEVTPEKELVWQFVAPHPTQECCPVYRAYRIPPEWVPGNPAGYPRWGNDDEDGEKRGVKGETGAERPGGGDLDGSRASLSLGVHYVDKRGCSVRAWLDVANDTTVSFNDTGPPTD